MTKIAKTAGPRQAGDKLAAAIEQSAFAVVNHQADLERDRQESSDKRSDAGPPRNHRKILSGAHCDEDESVISGKTIYRCDHYQSVLEL